jgi:hypothetical protein
VAENVPTLSLVVVPIDFVSKASEIVSLATNPLPFTTSFVKGGPEVEEKLSVAPAACIANLLTLNNMIPTTTAVSKHGAVIRLKRDEGCTKNLTFIQNTDPSHLNSVRIG